MLVHVGSHQTRNFAVKGMGVLVYTKLNKSHLCAFAKKKKKSLMVSWTALRGVLPAGQGR